MSPPDNAARSRHCNGACCGFCQPSYYRGWLFCHQYMHRSVHKHVVKPVHKSPTLAVSLVASQVTGYRAVECELDTFEWPFCFGETQRQTAYMGGPERSILIVVLRLGCCYHRRAHAVGASCGMLGGYDGSVANHSGVVAVVLPGDILAFTRSRTGHGGFRWLRSGRVQRDRKHVRPDAPGSTQGPIDRWLSDRAGSDRMGCLQ